MEEDEKAMDKRDWTNWTLLYCGRWSGSFCLETVYDERRLSDAELKSLFVKERSVRALGKIRRILDEDTADEDCFSRIEAIVKVYEAIGADGGARHDF